MTGYDAMRRAVENSGKSNRAISLEIGRGETFVTSTLRQASKPTADTLALIGGACGYRLALVPDACELPGGAIIVD